MMDFNVVPEKGFFANPWPMPEQGTPDNELFVAARSLEAVRKDLTDDVDVSLYTAGRELGEITKQLRKGVDNHLRKAGDKLSTLGAAVDFEMQHINAEDSIASGREFKSQNTSRFFQWLDQIPIGDAGMGLSDGGFGAFANSEPVPESVEVPPRTVTTPEVVVDSPLVEIGTPTIQGGTAEAGFIGAREFGGYVRVDGTTVPIPPQQAFVGFNPFPPATLTIPGRVVGAGGPDTLVVPPQSFTTPGVSQAVPSVEKPSTGTVALTQLEQVQALREYAATLGLRCEPIKSKPTLLCADGTPAKEPGTYNVTIIDDFGITNVVQVQFPVRWCPVFGYKYEKV